MKRALIVLVAAIALPAQANVWDHALERGSPDPAQDVYDSEMKTGDELAMQANAKGASFRTVRQLVDHAVLSYRNAANAKPKEGEPYYRIGTLLYSFYFDCDNNVSLANISPLCFTHDIQLFDRKHAQEVVDAWDAFEARAPLDPRLSVHLGDSDILFKRAILNTKLVTKEHLLAATHDYEKILQRADTSTDTLEETVWSNLAETYMMLGRLDEAIDTYREAIRRGGSTATVYGLAVALDRNESPEAARDMILSAGESALEQFHTSVARGGTFFVPYGEQFYYYALTEEAFDHYDEAIEFWQKYIQSGAHPEYQPRAKAHLAALATKRHGGVPKARWQELLP